jgi:hypothetical protein
VTGYWREPGNSPRLEHRSMHWLATLLTVAMLYLSACSDSTPPIGRGLPTNIKEAKSAFDQRVKSQFPVGSDEAKLLAELRLEHFEVTKIEVTQNGASQPYNSFSATAQTHNFPCLRTWVVLWYPVGGVIFDIVGVYDARCL